MSEGAQAHAARVAHVGAQEGWRTVVPHLGALAGGGPDRPRRRARRAGRGRRAPGPGPGPGGEIRDPRNSFHFHHEDAHACRVAARIVVRVKHVFVSPHLCLCFGSLCSGFFFWIFGGVIIIFIIVIIIFSRVWWWWWRFWWFWWYFSFVTSHGFALSWELSAWVVWE